MSNSYNTSKGTKITALEALGRNIVKAISENKFEFNKDKPVKIATLDKESTGIGFRSNKNEKGATLTVSKISKTSSKDEKKTNNRFTATISFPGKEKGMVNKTELTGKYARLAYIAITKEPIVRVPKISDTEALAASAALGF